MAAFFHGYVTVAAAGTAVSLASGSFASAPAPATVPRVCNFITIYPRKVGSTVNAGEVRIGGNPSAIGASAAIPQGSGMPLLPGDSGVAWPAGAYYDLNEIFVDADNSGDGVQFVIGVN